MKNNEKERRGTIDLLNLCKFPIMYVALDDVWWKMIVGRGIGTWVVRGGVGQLQERELFLVFKSLELVKASSRL